MKLLVGSVMVLSALADLPRSLGVGSFSALGFITVFFILLALITWVSSGLFAPRVGLIALFLGLFFAWGGVSFVWYEPTIPGIQNLLVVAAFVLLILAVSDRAYFSPGLPWYAGRMLSWSTALAGAAYAVSVVLDGPGAGSILSARAFSLFAMTGLAWSLAAWRYRSGRWFWVAAALAILVVISLSRLAMITALLMFPLAWFSPRSAKGWIRTALVISLVGGLFYFAATRFEPLHDRFFESGPSQPIHVGRLEVTGTGRASFWPAAWDSFLESPWIGKGAGSSGQLISQLFPGNDHPHNDYLRVLHDYGSLGLLLWVLGFLTLAGRIWAAWARADRAGEGEAQLHLAAFLGLVGLALGMIANNPFVYVFVMCPIAVVAGASLGRIHGLPEHQVTDERSRTRKPLVIVPQAFG
ncbi:MAG: O-antigen ligase family protein [Actinomycetota bacterium]